MYQSILPLALACALSACGPREPRPVQARAEQPAGDPGQVDKQVIVEKMPDGSVRKTTITTTRRAVEAPVARPHEGVGPRSPPRPADPMPPDPLVRHNVERVNAYRAQKNLPALLYDAKISAFANAGSERLGRDHTPHAHFAENARGAQGFGSRSAENQGDPSGVPALDADPIASGKKQIEVMLKMMMDEGPGGGHHDNMMNPRFHRVGIGLIYIGGRLYLTNDFSD